MNTGSVLAEFNVTLSKAVAEPVAVDWYTSDGTAKATVDYQPNKGTVLFAPGETSKKVQILVYGRAVGTEDRSFFVEMLPPVNAILGASIGECLIHVDATGSQPVTQIIVPKGEKGDEGDSAYQTWLQLPGNAGKTEQEFIDSLKPSPADIAQDVAPLINVGDMVVTSDGTQTLGKPDQLTVKNLARRTAYAARAKIATLTLADGDNTITTANLTGDAVDFAGAGFVPRILRADAFFEPSWRLNSNGSILIYGAQAGDVLYATQYNFVSDYNSRAAILSVTEPSPYVRERSFEKGLTVKSAIEAILYEGAAAGDGPYFVWNGSYPKTINPGSTPLTAGGIGQGAWESIGKATSLEYVQSNYKRRKYAKSPSSFLFGGKAKSGVSALFNAADGMYYTPRAGERYAPRGSVPDSNWVCVGLLGDLYEPGDLRNFGAIGDGVADDTAAIKLWFSYINFSKDVGVAGEKSNTFDHYHVEFKEAASNMWISGLGTFRNRAGQTGAKYYADGAQFTFSGGAQDMLFYGITMDGNRDGSPSYTGFNHSIQFVTGTGDFRSNNGGENKPNRRIRFSQVKFKNQGGFNAGIDKFGDAIYLFGCDDVTVEDCDFKDVGRWAIAGSDVFNVKIIRNTFDCTKAGTVALGFVDIENESTDNVNGSASRDILIAFNNLRGFGQILVGAGANSENYQGAKHYLRNVLVTQNTLTVTGGPHNDANYETNLLYMGLAPFNYTTTPTQVENSNIAFVANILRNERASLSVGMGINGQSTGAGATVKNVAFHANIITGFSKGVQGAGVTGSSGYTLQNVRATENIIDCEDKDNSIGIRLSATQLPGLMVFANTVRRTKTRAISIEDGRDFGAIDTYGIVGDNILEATAGSNMFAYAYRLSMMGNKVAGGATALDATITIVDKDFGNTWNSLQRSVPGFTVATNSQVGLGGIDVGAQTRFGYTVSAAAPFIMDQLMWHANITEPGFAILLLLNHTGATQTKAASTWTFTVEKR